jgi:hypothetical protein
MQMQKVVSGQLGRLKGEYTVKILAVGVSPESKSKLTD